MEPASEGDAMIFTCECGTRLRVHSHEAGQKERMACPKCGRAFSLRPALPPIIQVRRRRRSSWVAVVSILAVLLLIGGGAGTAYYLCTLDADPSFLENMSPVSAVQQAKSEKSQSEKGKSEKGKWQKAKSEKAKSEKAKWPDPKPEKSQQGPAEPPPLFPLKNPAAPLGSKPEAKPAAEVIAPQASPIILAGMTAPKSDPEQIAKAVRRGIEFLKKDIKPSGTWLKEDESVNAVGYAALPALALLESKVSADDPVVQNAAAYVRKQAAQMVETYDLGMAVLFLEKLGETRDKALIRSLALRIVAGQSPAGGWDYKCPVVTPDEERQLLKFLQRSRPKADFLKMLPAESKDNRRSAIPASDLREAAPRQDGVSKPTNGPRQPASKADERRSADAGKGSLPEPPPKGVQRPTKNRPDSGNDPEQVAKVPAELAQLSPRLRELPIVQYKQTKEVDLYHRDDNSNTQFALLALWAARRHGVPSELSLELAGKRFQLTQRNNGGWGYVNNAPTKNAMTCVGLLGLALGHGSAAEAAARAAGKNKSFALPNPPYTDPHVLWALDALGEYLDGDIEKRGLEARKDFYFLWTLERVGVLYQRKTFGKQDWYDWGSAIIVQSQLADGSWLHHYPPAVETSFALLFLNRSNPIGSLREALPHYLAVPERERAAPDPPSRRKDEPMREKGN
jgi:hypothetical protein